MREEWAIGMWGGSGKRHGSVGLESWIRERNRERDESLR